MEVKLWTLLLVLSCLVHCPCAEENPTGPTPTPTAIITTTTPTTPTTASRALPPTQKEPSATAPPTTAAPTTKPPANLPTTKTPAPAANTPFAPSGGGQTGQQAGITTVSKTVETPAPAPSKSSEQSVAQVATTGTAPPPKQGTAVPTRPPVPGTTATAPAQPPAPKGPTTPENQGPGAASATAATAATTEGAGKGPKADVTTKRDDRGATGTSAAVTSKPSPAQHPGQLGSTAPPMTLPPHPSSKAPTAVTRGRSGPDPVRPSTTESKDQSSVQTSAPSSASNAPAPIAASTPASAPIAASTPASTPAPIAASTPASTPAPIAASTPASTPASTAPASATTPASASAPAASTAAPTAAPGPRIFTYSLNRGGAQEQDKDLVSLCRQLMGNLEDGNCTLWIRDHNQKVQFEWAEIQGRVKNVIVSQQFEDITKKPTDNRTLITILASCGALLIMIIILAVCASHHRKPYENQQHLTDELQTVENGYHDNPTLEVMEVQALESEKKLNLNGEFNDSWIVPMDNLLKEEGPDEEDTHL